LRIPGRPARGPAADLGVCPTVCADVREWENYVALSFQLVLIGLRPTKMHENGLVCVGYPEQFTQTAQIVESKPPACPHGP